MFYGGGFFLSRASWFWGNIFILGAFVPCVPTLVCGHYLWAIEQATASHWATRSVAMHSCHAVYSTHIDHGQVAGVVYVIEHSNSGKKSFDSIRFGNLIGLNLPLVHWYSNSNLWVIFIVCTAYLYLSMFYTVQLSVACIVVYFN